MSFKFKPDEIFAMAERIEENGAAFYRKIATARGNAKDAEFLLAMADTEDEHKRIIATLRSGGGAAQNTGVRANDPSLAYLLAIADRHQGEGSPQVAATLTGTERLQDVLAKAVELEQKSILFYLGLKDMVPDPVGKAGVEEIIAQEKEHVARLSQELNALAE